MIRRLWALAGVALLGTAGIAGALVVSSSGGEEEVVQEITSPTPMSSSGAIPEAIGPPIESEEVSTPTPHPECDANLIRSANKQWRWLDLTIFLPEEPGFQAVPRSIPSQLKPPDGGPGLNIVIFHPSDSRIVSSVLVDAQTGVVVSEEVRQEHHECAQAVKERVQLSPFDPEKAPWPYNGELPVHAPRETWGGISFVRPDPSTGIVVEQQVGSGSGSEIAADECPVAAEGLGIWNGRSFAGIWLDSETDALCSDFSRVRADELATFRRYLSDIRPCNKDTETC